VTTATRDAPFFCTRKVVNMRYNRAASLVSEKLLRECVFNMTLWRGDALEGR